MQPFSEELTWRSIVKVVFWLAVIASIVYVYVSYGGGGRGIYYIAVFLLGGLLGLTEIMGRYTDSPMAALKSPGAFIYVLLNALASCLALYLLTTLAPNAVTNPISQVLLAGLGAMAFLRSSVFKVKVQEEEVAVGPAVVLDTLLKFADAQVDRGRAVDRATRITSVVSSLPLAQASTDLPRLCFALMQNVPVDTRQRGLDEITLVVTDTKRSDPVKVLEIGLVLWGRVGFGTLSGAIDAIKQMNDTPAGQSQNPPAAANIVPPPPPTSSPAELLPSIKEQLALDRAKVAPPPGSSQQPGSSLPPSNT
jgi:hypothetical protein